VHRQDKKTGVNSVNLFDLLMNGVPAAQGRVNQPLARPMITLNDLLGMVKKAERVPGIKPHAQQIEKPINNALSTMQNISNKVNAPFNAVNDAVDHTLGLGFIRDWAEKQGMVNKDSFDTSPIGILRYIIQAQKEPVRPNMTLDTNGLLPKPYEYKRVVDK
jgi:hypothetical protein